MGWIRTHRAACALAMAAGMSIGFGVAPMAVGQAPAVPGQAPELPPFAKVSEGYTQVVSTTDGERPMYTL